MIILLLIFLILTLFIEKKIYGLKNPIFYIYIWWMGWLILANCNSNIKLSFKTNSFFSINILVFYLFSIFFRKIKFHENKLEKKSRRNIEKMCLYFEKTKYIWFTVNLISLIFLFKYLNKNNISYVNYRELLFINTNLSIEIFGSILRKLFFFANIFYLFFYSKSLFEFAHGRYKNCIFYLINFVLLDTINGSRSYIFVSMLILGVFTLCFSKRIKDVILIFFSLSIIIIAISLFRTKGFKVLELLKINLFYYHTIPFALFNKEFIDNSSLLNTLNSYGNATGGLLFVMIGKLLNINYPIEIQNILTKNFLKFVNIGRSTEFYYNAFYTIFYNFYIDGGLLLNIIIDIYYAYIFSKYWNLYKINKDYYSFVNMYILILLGITSIYFSVTYTYYWYILIIILFLNVYKNILKIIKIKNLYKE